MNREFKDQVEMLKELETRLSPGTVAEFSYGVLLTSLAQSIGLSFQASALNMQGAMMTQQAANVRSVVETYSRCRHSLQPCCDGPERAAPERAAPERAAPERAAPEPPAPAAEKSSASRRATSETQAAARAILEALEPEPELRSNGGEPR